MRLPVRTLLLASATLAVLLVVLHDRQRAESVRSAEPAATARHDSPRLRVDPGGAGVTDSGAVVEDAPIVAEASARPAVGLSRVLAHLPPRPGDPGQVARELLDENAASLGLTRMTGELVLEREFASLSGHHVRFVQAIHGVPVETSRVAAHVAPDGRPLLVQADTFPLVGWTGDAIEVEPTVTPDGARAAVRHFLKDDDATGEAAPDVRTPELLIRPEGRRGALAWRVGVRTGGETLAVYIDARDGAVLGARALTVAAEGRAMLFDPNPIHSEGDPTLTDRGDNDYGALDRARRLVTLPRLDGTGFVRGTWADTTSSPVLAFAADLDWTHITRSHSGFEQLMAYYHIDRVQERLQALGLENVNAESQDVDAHARSQDQSVYNVLDDILEFGDGGVDDAEDGDIIVHEYGHAMQFDQVGDFGRTGEGGAMGEGFADFLAAVMHESARPSWDVLVAAWDATVYSKASPPFLRRVDGGKRYPRDLERQVHEDGEIWSAFLWDVRQLIGADDALAVAVESHFFLTPNARFRQATEALIVANIAVRDSRDDASIRELVDARGLPNTLPLAPLPPEEDSEDNDTLETAAPLGEGFQERLLLADEDWFRVRVPAMTRIVVRASFDPAGIDLDLSGHGVDGVLALLSDGVAGVEEIQASAATEPFDLFVRVHHADGDVRPGAYDLQVIETALEALGPKQTVVRRMYPGTQFAFRVLVGAADAEAGSRLVIKTRKLRRGSKADLRLVAPDGEEVVDVVAAKRRRGGKVKVKVDRPGAWLGVATPRDGKTGRYKLKVRLR